MKNYFKIFITILLSMILCSCATIFSGTTQNISVQTVDASTNKELSTVNCVLIDSKGVHHPIVGNPGNVMVSKSFGEITPHCIKEGYTQRNFGVGNSFNAVTIVNVLFWPGFIVDGLTGAMNKYPSHITVFMQPN